MNHGGCRISTHRESTRAAFGLLQHSEKNSVTAYRSVSATASRYFATRSRDQHTRHSRTRTTCDVTSCTHEKKLKMHDEIRVFAAAFVRCVRASTRNFPRSAHCVSRQHCSQCAGQRAQIILHRWRRGRLADSQNRPITSESVQGDSGDSPPSR